MVHSVIRMPFGRAPWSGPRFTLDGVAREERGVGVKDDSEVMFDWIEREEVLAGWTTDPEELELLSLLPVEGLEVSAG